MEYHDVKTVPVPTTSSTALSLEPTSFKIPFSNFKPSINKYILEEWQTSWNNSIGNKLLDIKPTIGEYQSVVRNIRREEVVPGESLPPCRGLWGTLHTGDDIDCNTCLLWEC